MTLAVKFKVQRVAGEEKLLDKTSFSSLANPEHEFGTENFDGKDSGVDGVCRSVMFNPLFRNPVFHKSWMAWTT
jgi:hypothetical protein